MSKRFAATGTVSISNRTIDYGHGDGTSSSATSSSATTATTSTASFSTRAPTRIFPSSGSINGNGLHGVVNGSSESIKGASSSSTSNGASDEKLGTLDGVFLPCIQNILGVILFLRLTNITGQAGTVLTSVIILMSAASTTLTALSLSAIATNGTIQAGGPYYVISRTLGIEIGATLGLLFYLGTSLASTMYVLGAVEALQRTVVLPFLNPRWASLLLMWAVAAIVSIGVKWVNMASNFFLFLVMLSIVSMTLGCILFATGTYFGLLNPSDRVLFENTWPNYQPDPVTGHTPDFWSLLAIFYPSVTGILAGSNRSSVLKDPATSIPVGTLGAIGFTTFIYLSTVWLFGSVLRNPILIHDKFCVAAVAWPWEHVVSWGVMFSSVGAALQTCAGAPRVLAAIAMDDVLPMLKWLQPSHPNEEPTRAIWFTWVLASLPTLAGNLDHITPLVTLFFLLMYAGINLSCFLLHVLKSPGFRPTFRYFHWSTSFLGFVWCLGLVALVAHWSTVFGVVIIMSILWLYTKRQRARKEWGDVGNALRYTIATTAIKALSTSRAYDEPEGDGLFNTAATPNTSGGVKRNGSSDSLNGGRISPLYNNGNQTQQQYRDVTFHAKNWRPQLLTVVDTNDNGSPTNLHILTLAKQLRQGGGGIHMVTSIMRMMDTPSETDRPNDRAVVGAGLESTETVQQLGRSRLQLLHQLRSRNMLENCFPNVVPATSSTESSRQALWSAVIHCGLGPLSPNAVLLNYPERSQAKTYPPRYVVSRKLNDSRDESSLQDFCTTLQGIMNLKKAVLLFRGKEDYAAVNEYDFNPSQPTIDVWWVIHDGGLLLLLPYIIAQQRHGTFKTAQLRLFAVTCSPTENPERLKAAVLDHLSKVRITTAKVQVVDLSDTTIGNDMRESSSAPGRERSKATTGSSSHRNGGEVGSTHHLTVGEVFSNESYEIPYHAVQQVDLDEEDTGNERQEYDFETPVASHVMVDDAQSMESSSATITDDGAAGSTSGTEERMRTAKAFNSALRQLSGKASLVVTNMPLIRPDHQPSDFFQYMDQLSYGIDNMLFIRGSGVEVITTYV